MRKAERELLLEAIGVALLWILVGFCTPTAHAQTAATSSNQTEGPGGFYTGAFVKDGLVHVTVHQSGTPGTAGATQFLVRFRYLNDGMIITPSIVGGDLTTAECNTISCGLVWNVPNSVVDANLDISISGVKIPSVPPFVVGDMTALSILPTGGNDVLFDWTPLNVAIRN